MKPDFKAMTRSELLTYIKEHRENEEAWGVYLDSLPAGGKRYPPPVDEESIKIMENAIREKIQEVENKLE